MFLAPLRTFVKNSLVPAPPAKLLVSPVQARRLRAIGHSGDQYYRHYPKVPRNGKIRLYPAAVEVPKMSML